MTEGNATPGKKMTIHTPPAQPQTYIETTSLYAPHEPKNDGETERWRQFENLRI